MAPESILINPSDLTPAFAAIVVDKKDISNLIRSHGWSEECYKHATQKNSLYYIRLDLDPESSPGDPRFLGVKHQLFIQHTTEIYLVFGDDSNFAIRSRIDKSSMKKYRALPPLVLKDLKRLTSYKSV